MIKEFRYNAKFSTDELNSELLEIDRILSDDLTDNNALLYKGWILSKLGLFDEAISIYDAILSVQPDNSMALMYRKMAIQNKDNLKKD